MKLDKKITLQKNTVNDPVHVLYFILSNCNMLAFAKKLTRCSELAQDLFQDTVERILKYAEKFEHRGDGHTKSWATSIMYTIFVNNYRKKKLNSTRENQFYIESLIDQVYEMTNDSEDILESELSSPLIHAMSALTERQRKVIMLIAQDYQYNEIAENLAIPMGTVMSTLCRGRQAIKRNDELLKYVRKEYGITP